MTISQYIEFLEELKEKYGDIEISIDARAHEEALKFDTKLKSVFGED